MRALHSGDFGFLVGCDRGPDASSTPTSGYSGERLVCTDDEDWAASRSAELRGAECIDVLRSVIELALDQRHELGVTTASAVIGVQRDDEIRDMAEPLLDLHLGTSAGPLAHRALWRSCLTLADDTPALLAVADDGPEEADVSVSEMSVVRIVHRRHQIEERCLYPVWHVFGWRERW